MQNNPFQKHMTGVLSSTLKNIRSRKTVSFFILFGCFVLYLASTYLLPAHRHFHPYQTQSSEELPWKTSCLSHYMQKWNRLMEVNDAVVKKIPWSPSENRFFPFTGNGNIAFGMQKDKMQFYLLTNGHKVESYLPVLDIHIRDKHAEDEQAVVLSIKDGIVFAIKTYLVNKSCVLIKQMFNAHRKNTGVFQHDIEIFNKGDMPITVTFQLREVQKSLKVKNMHSTLDSESKYIRGNIETKIGKNKGIANFTTVLSSFQPTLRVRNKDKNKVSLTSLTEFGFVIRPSKEKVEKKRRNIEPTPAVDTDKTVKRMTKTLRSLLKSGDLFRNNIDSWNEIWKAGITISSEHDPNSPSPLHVNLTEYYLYSTTRYNERDVDTKHCFSGPSTVHVAKYWVIPTSLDSLYEFKRTWVEYFKQNGCEEAQNLTSLALSRLMMLSMIGFQYQKQHLQMALNPLNLHSNISIRHMSLNYFHTNNTLELRVVVTQRSLESLLIFATCDGKHDQKIYACASACERVVELGTSTLKFSVHTTDPVTPLFYISSNRTHLERIPHAPFMKVAVKTAREIRANPHHTKLSPKFWLAVVVLIVSFHVVVLKMIYNECRKNRASGRGGRTPYIS